MPLFCPSRPVTLEAAGSNPVKPAIKISLLAKSAVSLGVRSPLIPHHKTKFQPKGIGIGLSWGEEFFLAGKAQKGTWGNQHQGRTGTLGKGWKSALHNRRLLGQRIGVLIISEPLLFILQVVQDVAQTVTNQIPIFDVGNPGH